MTTGTLQEIPFVVMSRLKWGDRNSAEYRQYVEVGEVRTFGHLSDADIRLLERKGIIRPEKAGETGRRAEAEAKEAARREAEAEREAEKRRREAEAERARQKRQAGTKERQKQVAREKRAKAAEKAAEQQMAERGQEQEVNNGSDS
jgi:colicin import membrane protein